MSSVTQRIQNIKQPKGGYIPTSSFTSEHLSTKKELHEEENIHPTLIGLVVDYMSRYLTGTPKSTAFSISLLGASFANQSKTASKLLNGITGLNKKSIINASKLVGYDVCYRKGPSFFKGIDEINPNDNTVDNITIMIKRSLNFFENNGPKVLDGITFEGGYTSLVSSGDADFITKDTLWDFKVSKNEITSNHTLQLLVYYLLGKNSIHKDYFESIKYLGIFNPRLNIIYKLEISTISEETIKAVSEEVIGYKNGKNADGKSVTSNNLMTIQDIMKELQVTRNTVMKWYTYDNLPLIKKGNRYYITGSDYYSWVENQKEKLQRESSGNKLIGICILIIVGLILAWAIPVLNNIFKVL